MEAKIKKLKSQVKEEESDDLDRLSSLPDSVLIYILSFLDTETSIRTSVLSKRYKLLWTLSQSLDFKLPLFRSDTFEAYDGYAFPRVSNCRAAFEAYVNRVLQLREHSNLVSFRLSLHKDVSLEFLQNCIDYAAHHKVQHLRVRGYAKRKPVTLPNMLLMSTSLVTLSLNNAINYCIDLPKSISLPNLKLLRLKKFEFADGNYNGELFTGCPKLETLVLSKCCIKPRNEMKILELNCLNLKSLEICYWRSPWRCFHEHQINVRAPQLNYFFYKGHLARMNFKYGLLCLDKACIDLCYPTACIAANAIDRKQRTSEVFFGMLRDINNVKTLSLSSKTIEVLYAIPDLQERFHTIFENLRLLKFTVEHKYREMTMPMGTVARSLKKIVSDMLVFHGSKELKLSPACSNVNCKSRDPRHITIPKDVMELLLESCPSAKLLSVELPKE
ncbi:F-box/LRR-repeat protein At1g55660-like [Andrographis paniculata]|uniref:F-box/LRR-repeat protein At1g55660-like n=1 Tax=Andrographis paniculata TaxID=175694 RepID=UPI0021E8F4BB|nr:F-box/LRR-repeat protein At1g55660-like [Andrographis paniculata]